MAVQFNLLPDVKLEYDRSQHAKRLVYLVSSLASAIAVAIFVVSFLSVNVLQKTLLNKANDDITTYSKKLQSIPDLDKILTVQGQLNTLPSLHKQKHIGSRLFDYLPKITPANVSIGKLNMDTTASTISIEGTADTVESVNKFVDTLKYTTYQTAGSTDSNNAFSNVLLTKIGRDDKGATYTITCNFDPALFKGASNITLNVPQEITTRSVINAPTNPLFNGQTGTKVDQQQQGTQ